MTSQFLSSRSLQFGSDGGVLKGTEALIRWRHANFEDNDFSFEQDVQVESLIGNWENGTGVWCKKREKLE